MKPFIPFNQFKIGETLSFHFNTINDIISYIYPTDSQTRLISCSSDTRIVFYNILTRKIDQVIDPTESLNVESGSLYCLKIFEERKKVFLLVSSEKAIFFVYELNEKTNEFEMFRVINVTELSSNESMKLVTWNQYKLQRFIVYDRMKILCTVKSHGRVIMIKNFLRPYLNDGKTTIKRIYDMNREKGVLYSNIHRLRKSNHFVLFEGKDCRVVRLDMKDLDQEPFLFKRIHKSNIWAIDSFVKVIKEFVVSSGNDKLVVIWNEFGNPEKIIRNEESVNFRSIFFLANSLIILGGDGGELYSLKGFISKEETIDTTDILILSMCVVRMKGYRATIACCGYSESAIIEISNFGGWIYDEDPELLGERIKYLVDNDESFATVNFQLSSDKIFSYKSFLLV